MKCCGKHRTTAFCPDCGNAVNANPILQITSFIKGKLKSSESVRERNEEWDKQNPDRAVDGWRERKRAAHLRKIEKYKSWIKALEELKD